MRRPFLKSDDPNPDGRHHGRAEVRGRTPEFTGQASEGIAVVEEPPAGNPTSGSVHNRMSGSARNVVQARDISGGVHFHHADAAPVPSAAPPPRQLPAGIAHFVNRSAEFRGLASALSAAHGTSSRIPTVVITGAPGVGKTSLALRWAHQVAERFPDGQLYVNLRGHDYDAPLPPIEVLHGFLTALGIMKQAVPEDLEAAAALFRSCLANRTVLLLLDNAADAAQVRPLLPAGPGSLTIVTSRSRLSGLSVREGAHRMVLDLLSEAEAVALLRTVIEGHRTDDDPDELAELARLCARLPLALRIAGERIVSHPHLRLADLIAQLRDHASRWHALSTDEEGSYDVRTVFDWSYQALPAPVARLFRLLGAHPGIEFSLHAAAALASVSTIRARLLLDKLTAAHLLEQIAADRFQFHDLLRVYAADQFRALEPADEQQAASRRLLSWYFQAATTALLRIEPQVTDLPTPPPVDAVEPLSLPDRDQAIAWFHREHANLNAAVRAAAQAGLDEFASKLPLVLWRSNALPITSAELIDMAGTSLEASRRLGDRAGEARMLTRMGRALSNQRRFAESLTCQRQALALHRELHDRLGEAMSLGAIGLDHFRAKEHDTAASWLEAACEVFQEVGEPRLGASTMVDLAHCKLDAGHGAEAAVIAERALEAHLAVGDRQGEGRALRVLGNIHRSNGDLRAALRAAQRSVECAVHLKHPRSEATRLLSLAAVQEDLDLFDDALACYARAAKIFRGVDDHFYEAMAWYYSAAVYHRVGRDAEAESLLRQAAAVFYSHSDRWQEALTLDRLASVVRATDVEQARRLWRTALRQVAEFDSRGAAAVRARIEARLAEAGPGDADGPPVAD
ncbi:ATP-binding protein [Streptomyces odontomachi]|uniref:ATP-binding protein n=1 Tax=Streptomyces odontomachi TaxID=2944940 RepID=UPI00210E07F2|nr:tetratricopeptide repeat protein [Streptomyces sp. ODS25]